MERPFFMGAHGLSLMCNLGSFHYENAGIELVYDNVGRSED